MRRLRGSRGLPIFNPLTIPHSRPTTDSSQRANERALLGSWGGTTSAGGRMSVVTPIPLQQRFWNEWNSSTGRTKALDDVSSRQSKIVCEWLSALGRTDLNI